MFAALVFFAPTSFAPALYVDVAPCATEGSLPQRFPRLPRGLFDPVRGRWVKGLLPSWVCAAAARAARLGLD